MVKDATNNQRIDGGGTIVFEDFDFNSYFGFDIDNGFTTAFPHQPDGSGGRAENQMLLQDQHGDENANDPLALVGVDEIQQHQTAAENPLATTLGTAVASSSGKAENQMLLQDQHGGENANDPLALTQQHQTAAENPLATTLGTVVASSSGKAKNQMLLQDHHGGENANNPLALTQQCQTAAENPFATALGTAVASSSGTAHASSSGTALDTEAKRCSKDNGRFWHCKSLAIPNETLCVKHFNAMLEKRELMDFLKKKKKQQELMEGCYGGSIRDRCLKHVKRKKVEDSWQCKQMAEPNQEFCLKHMDDGGKNKSLVGKGRCHNKKLKKDYQVKATIAGKPIVKFTIHSSTPIEEVREKVGQKLEIEGNSFFMIYIDGSGDQVSMAEQENLDDALDVVDDKGLNLLWLTIELK